MGFWSKTGVQPGELFFTGCRIEPSSKYSLFFWQSEKGKLYILFYACF